MPLVVNIIAFKVAWIVTILASAGGAPQIGPLVVLVAVAIHLRLAAEPGRELILVLLTGAVGVAWDSVMVSAGWLTYPNGMLVGGLAPYWILAIWMLFATTLNVSFRWLRDRPVLAAVVGALCGPASYLAGSAAGAVDLPEPAAALTSLAVAWALFMPGLLFVAAQLDGFAAPAPARESA